MDPILQPPASHWTILKSEEAEPERKRQSLQRLTALYAPAALAMVKRRGGSIEEARRLLAGLAAADLSRHRGSFRTALKSATPGTNGAALQVAIEEVSIEGDRSPEDQFDEVWRRLVFGRARETAGRRLNRIGKAKLLDDWQGSTEARQEFRRAVVDIVSEYVDGALELSAELAELGRGEGPESRGFRDECEAEVARLAARRGHITQAQLGQALQAEMGAARFLLSQGWLQNEDLDSFSVESAQRELSRIAVGAMPPEARSSMFDPSRNLGEYVLVSQLGHGGFGEVWKAWDRRGSRWVAVKLPRIGWDESARKRFLREASAISRLSHPHIVRVLRVGEHQGRPYLVMPFLTGQTVDDARLSMREAAGAIRVAALAIQHAHDRGIVHRDLKPANIMVDGKGGVWVLDLGLAHDSEGSTLTTTGMVFGTPHYMAPEQAKGGKARGPLIDVYSLGATLYDLVTGRPPFTGENAMEIGRRVIEADLVRPRQIVEGLPQDLEAVILRAMAREPEARYSSAAELAEELRRWLEGEPVQARAARSNGRWLRRAVRAIRSALGLRGS
jgi:hypothetical protein